MIKTYLQKPNTKKYAFLAALFVFVIFIIYSEAIKTAVRNSLEVCVSAIIPSLFPMLIISRIINEIKMPEIILHFAEIPMNKIFGLSANCLQALLTGLMGGYPLGVKNAVTLYKNKSISLNEAQRFSLFCVSPGFAFSVVLTGSCIFSNTGIGIRIFTANILANLTIAILTKNKKKPDFNNFKSEYLQKPFSVIISESITDSSSVIISICAWICFFSASSSVLCSFTHNSLIKNLIIVFSEVTNAVTFCAEHKNIILAAFCCGFSGGCIIFQLMQDLYFLSVKISSFVLTRLLCGFLSAAYEWIIITVFPVTIQTAAQNIHTHLCKYSATGSVALLFMCAIFIINTSNEKLKRSVDNKT